MEINSINPDAFWFDELGNTLDLGGGNKVEPYIVTEAAQHKLVGMKELTEPSFIPNVRIHEGGFRFVAGRAGIQTFTVIHSYFLTQLTSNLTEDCLKL